MGLNGLGVGQNCPPFPSETRPGRSVVSRGAYFLAGGFLGVEAGLLDSAADLAVVLSCFFLLRMYEVAGSFFRPPKSLSFALAPLLYFEKMSLATLACSSLGLGLGLL